MSLLGKGVLLHFPASKNVTSESFSQWENRKSELLDVTGTSALISVFDKYLTPYKTSMCGPTYDVKAATRDGEMCSTQRLRKHSFHYRSLRASKYWYPSTEGLSSFHAINWHNQICLLIMFLEAIRELTVLEVATVFPSI